MVLVKEENGPEIDPHIYMVNWFLTKVQRQFNEKRTGFFPTNCVGTTGYSY